MDLDPDPYWIRIWIGIQTKMPDPDPYKMNTDPQSWLYYVTLRYGMIGYVSVADPDPGSGIRCLFDPWIRDPGSGIGFFRIPDPGSRICIPDPKPIYLRAY